MKKVSALLALCFALAVVSCRRDAGASSSPRSTEASGKKAEWNQDFQKGLAQAKAEGKLHMLDFTGSDWCQICVMLENEVFSTEEFKAYAKKNLVLTEIDFPVGKELPKLQQEQNEQLREKFGVPGFPTLVILSPAGKTIGMLGYEEGGPKPLIEKLEELRKNFAEVAGS